MNKMKITKSQLKQIIKEELHAILNEQGGIGDMPQDIPTGGAPPPPDPDPAPVFTRTGRELTPEYLQSLGMPGEPGYESPEEYFEQNPENRPEYVAEVEPLERYLGEVPMGERGATILQQTGRDL